MWLDFGDGNRWPVNPIEWSSIVQAQVDIATDGIADKAQQAIDDSNTAVTIANNTAEPLRRINQTTGIGSIDARTGTPTQAVQFTLSSGAVIQCAVQAETGDWYVTQVASGSASGRETTVINRCDSTGALLDTMTVVDAGHGTFTYPQLRSDGNVYVWVKCRIYDTQGNITSANIYRTPYQSGTVDVPNASGTVKVIDVGPTETTQVMLDEGSNQACVLKSGKYYLYDLDDLESNGLNARQIGKTLSPGTSLTLQGFCLANGTMYRYTGTDNTSGGGDPKLLQVFSFNTGQMLYSRDLTSVLPAGEPESVSVTRDENGLPALYLGVSTGPGGSRISYVYKLRGGVGAALDKLASTSAFSITEGGSADLTFNTSNFSGTYVYLYRMGPVAYVMLQLTTTADISVPASGDVGNKLIATIKNTSPFFQIVTGPTNMGGYTSGTYSLSSTSDGAAANGYIKGTTGEIKLASLGGFNGSTLPSGSSLSLSGMFMLNNIGA